ncbi:polysaccharide deacetylase family protein [Microbacterium sp. ASV81]|uniref:Polysaccharide deacetylase family protein n=1 Tax=Microbacterium capsulatum TaxID=3041921 RepID=A0ABU0XDD1_9MICO|nr:polysaccharide deacetylase family protein [Microbacterium sp. ASV81]MDQ4213088.1 polysaccharide deacetylase family protein [Microbacterium sp. ASV81]
MDERFNEVGPQRDLIGYGRVKPRVTWPQNASLVVNFCIAYEEGGERSVLYGDERGESLGPGYPMDAGRRDLAVESIFEYGSRAGIWRLADLFDEHAVPVTLFAPALALEKNPEVCGWVAERGHDICSHGWKWIEPWLLSEEEERRQIAWAYESIERSVGRPPSGWRSRTGPSIRTRRLLAEHGGFLYDSDSYSDDLPYVTTVEEKEHLVVPYTLTYTEGRLVQPVGFTSPESFWSTCIAGMEELTREGRQGFPKMMSIGVHPRHTGQAGRMTGLRTLLERAEELGDVAFVTRETIARHWLEHRPDLITKTTATGARA